MVATTTVPTLGTYNYFLISAKVGHQPRTPLLPTRNKLLASCAFAVLAGYFCWCLRPRSQTSEPGSAAVVPQTNRIRRWVATAATVKTPPPYLPRRIILVGSPLGALDSSPRGHSHRHTERTLYRRALRSAAASARDVHPTGFVRGQTGCQTSLTKRTASARQRSTTFSALTGLRPQLCSIQRAIAAETRGF